MPTPKQSKRRNRMLNWLKKIWPLLLVIVAGLVIFGDAAQLAVTVYRLSAIALVILIVDLVLARRKEWGLFPSLDIDLAIDKALKGSYQIIDGRNGTIRKVDNLPAALIFMGVIALMIAILFIAVPAGASPLDQARPYLPQLSRAIDSQWPSMPMRQIAAGQVEQESGWKAHATLKTSRELGRGLTQMTVAYDSKGRERFNIYREACRAKALSAWDWQRDPYNVHYQLTFLVLQDRANFVQVRPYFKDDAEAHKGSLVCYNAGSGRWLSRRNNARRLGIPADRWDGGLDRAYGKGEAALLYGRPLYAAVNEYPRVIFKRSIKYQGLV
jgi:hypothetical protein